MVRAVDDLDELCRELRDLAAEGDMIICMGAGDITKWAGGARRRRLRSEGEANERRSHDVCQQGSWQADADAPLAPLVWFKSGGSAEWLFEPADEDDLVAVPARARSRTCR